MIKYFVDSEGVWVRDRVGGVEILVSAETALNAETCEALKKHLRKCGIKQGAGVFGVCEIK